MIKLNVGGWSFSVLASFFLSIFASFSERRKGHPLDDHDDVVDNVVVRLHSQRKETYLRDILEDLKIGHLCWSQSWSIQIGITCLKLP